MKIALRNWNENVSIVNVPDSTTEIEVVEISGDQIMVYPKFFDTGSENRRVAHFDGHKIFRIVELEEKEIKGYSCLLVPRL